MLGKYLGNEAPILECLGSEVRGHRPLENMLVKDGSSALQVKKGKRTMILRLLLLLCILGGSSMTAWSDEGMWLLNDPPRQRLSEKYGFVLDDDWLTHVQQASIRFNSGASGSFISPEGLILTNHHVGADAIQKLSTAERDLYTNGFYAATRDQELQCPDLELNVLQEIIDVTEQVQAAVTPEMSDADAFAARSTAIARIEKESLEKTGLRSDVVVLYQGGLYHLYRYKRYTDVRLVMAPEADIASFGGDVDNFEYPRYCLDVSFFRAYEDNQPAKIEHYLEWSRQPVQEGDLVFVTGHPGTTNRLETLAKLKHRRDITLPYTLAFIRSQEALLRQFAEQSPENSRRASRYLRRFANARKAYSGMYAGLLDPAILQRKRQEEVQFSQAGDRLSPEGKRDAQEAQERIAQIQQELAEFEVPYSLLERGNAFQSELFDIARTIVRLNKEQTRPNDERLREYRDSNRASLELQLFSPAPIYADLERARLTRSLLYMAEQLGGEHPLVVKLLAGKSVANRVDELIADTRLAEVAERRRLVEGGLKALDDSRDSMIRLAQLIDNDARRLRERYEQDVEEPERQAYATLSRFRFQLLGRSVAPDATFTLRLAYGTVQGYRAAGETIPFYTTLGGAFARAEALGGTEPFDLPARWRNGKAKLDLRTPFNFVSTADTIGGNSGSPVLNRQGQLVGVNFDRNRHGLVRNFVYTDEQARHIAVHAAGIVEALDKLYDCPALIAEMLPGRD